MKINKIFMQTLHKLSMCGELKEVNMIRGQSDVYYDFKLKKKNEPLKIKQDNVIHVDFKTKKVIGG